MTLLWRFLAAASRILLVLGPLIWVLPWLILGVANADTASIALLTIFGGLVAGSPGLVRFFWSGPGFRPRPRLRAGQLIPVQHLWRHTNAFLIYFVVTGSLFFLLTPAEGENNGSGQGPGILMLLLAAATLVLSAVQRYDPARDRAVVAAQMAGLLRMGIPLGEGLEMLALDARGRLKTRFQGLPQVLHYLSQDLKAGAQLSYAVSCQAYFPPYWQSLASLGERTDSLADELDRLSLLEQQRAASPGVLRLVITMIFVVLLGLFLDTYIRSTFEGVAESMQGTASFALWDVASALTRFTILAFLVAAGQRAFGTASLQRGRRVLAEVDAWVRLRLPLWGPALRLEQQSLAVLALLAGARQQRSLADMLGLARETVDLPPYQRLLDPQRAFSGTSLAGCLGKPAGLFEPEVIWLVRQGESTGQLAGALELAVAHLGELREDRQRRLMLGLDVGLQLFLGLVVAAYIFGFWLPMVGYYGLLLEDSVL